jgi:hypothetical protein
MSIMEEEKNVAPEMEAAAEEIVHEDKPLSETGYVVNPDGTVSSREEAKEGWDAN